MILGSGLFVLTKTEAEKLQLHRENLVMFKVNEMRGKNIGLCLSFYRQLIYI
jgi:hypothetical protein